MTTIATDGKMIAADTQQWGSYIDLHYAKKIWRIRGGLVGVAGDIAKAYDFVKWVKDGMPGGATPISKNDLEAIVVTRKGVWHYCDSLNGVQVGAPAAIGTGVKFAMGAMLAGASPRKALKIARRLDTGTGGRIMCLTL